MSYRRPSLPRPKDKKRVPRAFRPLAGCPEGRRPSGGARGSASLLALLLLASPALAAPPPGATSCSGCHGARADAAIPSLAGRPEEAIATALLAFRRGEGSPTVMDRIARGFSEPELRAIAAWVARP